jgi:hypothetical protein
MLIVDYETRFKILPIDTVVLQHDLRTASLNILSRVHGSMTDNNGFWIGLLDLLTPLQCLLITINYNSSQQMTA